MFFNKYGSILDLAELIMELLDKMSNHSSAKSVTQNPKLRNRRMSVECNETS
jgi:hypothetical protein